MRSLVILIMVCTGLLYSQDKSLIVGNVKLAIGMDASKVINAFPHGFSVSAQVSMTDATYLIQQQNTNEAGFKVIGQVNAIDGKITAITKYFGTYSVENYLQGLTDLYNLLSKTSEFKYSATSQSSADPQHKFKSIVFNNKNTSFSLNVGEYGFTLAETIR